MIVAPVRAILQRLGPLEGTAPIVIRPGQQVDVAELLPELVAMGYRREHQVEHRGEFAVRGGIVDVFPSTADVPVRIDLWGDEVDRLTAFSVSDQRSSHDLRAVALYGCRELVVTPALRDAASALVTRRPWGASVWENLAEGAQFDGMESWLPFLDDTARVLPDLLPAGAQVVLVEPRRIRDRGVQLLDEEAALAETLAATWGAKEGEEESFPRLHVPFERLLSESAAGVTALPPVPEGPDMAALTVRRFDPVAGDPARLAAGVTGLVGQGYSVTLCAATAAGSERLSAALAAEGVHTPVLAAAPGTAGASVVAAPITSGFILPEVKVAVLSETDVTGRRVPHRRARPRARAADGFFDDLEAGSFVVHRQHGVARFEGVTTRTMGGTTRDYLILQYRGSDRLYLPVEQIEAITPYSGGESPTLSKMGGSDWQKTRAKARAAASEVAAELVELYRRRLAVEGQGVRPRHAVADGDGGIVRLRRDRGPAQGDRRRESRHGGAAADGPPGVRRRGLRQDRGRGAGRLQGRAGRDAGRHPGPDHAAGQPARADLRRPLRAVPGTGGAAQPLPLTGPAATGRAGTGRRERRRGRRHPPPAGPGRAVQGPRASWWSTRNSASG